MRQMVQRRKKGRARVAAAVAAVCVVSALFATSALAADAFKAERVSASDLYNNGYYITLLRESNGVYGVEASGGRVVSLDALPQGLIDPQTGAPYSGTAAPNADYHYWGRRNNDKLCYVWPSLVDNQDANGNWVRIGGKGDAWAFVSDADAANNGASGAEFSAIWKKAGILRSTNGKLGLDSELPEGGIYVDIKVTTRLSNTIDISDYYGASPKAVVQYTNRFDWGFWQMGVTCMDQTFTFIDSATGSEVPIDGFLNVLGTSLDVGEGFMVKGASSSQVSGTAPLTNTHVSATPTTTGVHAKTHWSAVPGSYVYEVEEGGWLGYFGVPSVYANAGSIDANSKTDNVTWSTDAQSPLFNMGRIDYVDNKYDSTKGFRLGNTWFPTDSSQQDASIPRITYPWRSAAVEKAMNGTSSVAVRQYAVGYRQWPNATSVDTTFSDRGTITSVGRNTSNAANPSLDAGSVPEEVSVANNGLRYFTMSFSGAYGVHPTAPEKSFLSAGSDIMGVGEAAEYVLYQRVNDYGNDLFAPYESFSMQDVLDPSLEYVSARMLYQAPESTSWTDVTAKAGSVSFDAASRTVTFTFAKGYLQANGVGTNENASSAMVYKAGNYGLAIKVKVADDKKKTIYNKGTSTINGTAKRSEEIPLVVNTAKLAVTKNVKFENAVGDEATYTVTVENVEKDSVARNVTVSDALPKGLSALPGSLSVKWSFDGVAAEESQGYYTEGARRIVARHNSWKEYAYGTLTNAAGTEPDDVYLLDNDNWAFGGPTREAGKEVTYAAPSASLASDALSAKIPLLVGGVKATYTFKVKLDASTNGKEFFNTASASLDNPAGSSEKTVKATDGLWVNNAELSVTKSADAFEYGVGDTVTYTVKVANTKEGTIARNVAVSDTTLPADLQLDASSVKVSGMPDPVTYNVDGNGTHAEERRANKHVLSTSGNGWTLAVPYLPYGSTVTVTYQAKATEAANGKEVVNTAKATFDNPLDQAKKTVSAKDSVWVNSVKLDVAKNASTFEYRVGDTVTYTVLVENTAAEGTIAKNVKITDNDLPDAVSVEAGSVKVSGAPATVAYPVDNAGTPKKDSRTNTTKVTGSGNGFVVEIGYLPAGQKVTVTYQAKATAAANGKEHFNTVTAEPSNPLPGSGKATDKDGVWVNNAELAITKAADAFEYGVGDVVTYTVTLKNTAEGTVAENVVIDDVTLPEHLRLDPASVKVSGVPDPVAFNIDGKGTHRSEDRTNKHALSTSGNSWTLAVPYLPYGSTVTVTYQAKATEAANGKEVVNTAKAAFDNPLDPAKKTVSAKDSVWVNSVKLDLLKRADAFEYRVGDTVAYTVTLVNTAPEGTIARDVRITDDDLPERVKFNGDVKIEGVPATVAYPIDNAGTPKTEERESRAMAVASRNGFAIDIPYLPAGKLVTITYTATALEDSNGTETYNSATAEQKNPLPGNESTASKDGIWTNDAVLALSKDVEKYEHQVGEEVHYTVRFQNIAPYTVAKNVVMDDVTLPDGLVLQADSIRVEGVPERVAYYTDGDGSHSEEDRANAYRVNVEGNSFNVGIDYLPTGAEVTVAYTAVPTEDVNGDEVVNTAKVAAENVLGDTGAQDDALIWVNTPHLKVSKTVAENKVSYKQGDTVTYRIQVDNEATGTFARNIKVSDSYASEGMRLVRSSVFAFDIDGSLYDGSTYAVKQNMFDANWNVESTLNLVSDEGNYRIWEDRQEREAQQWNPLGETHEQRIYIEYQAVVTADELSGEEVLNAVTAWADNAEKATDDETIAVVDPDARGALDVVKSSDPADGTAVKPGDTIAYTLSATNSGDAPLEGVAVFDAIPAHTSFATSEDGMLNAEGAGIGWRIDRIEPGETAICSFSVVVDEDIMRGDEVRNVATFDTDAPAVPDKNLPYSTNEITHPTDVPAPVVLEGLHRVQTTKSADPEHLTRVEGGQRIIYTLTTTNTGDEVAPHTIVRDYIPAGATYVAGSASAGGAFVEPQAAEAEDRAEADEEAERAYVEFSIENLSPGQSVENTFVVVVDEDAEGTIENVALTSEVDRPAVPGDPDNPKPEDPSNTVEHPIGSDPNPDPADDPTPDPDPEPEPKPDPTDGQEPGGGSTPDPEPEKDLGDNPMDDPTPGGTSTPDPEPDPAEDPEPEPDPEPAPAKLRVRYVTEDGLLLDAYNETIPAGSYETDKKEFDGYEFKEMDATSDPANGEVAEGEEARVVYVYRRLASTTPADNSDSEPGNPDPVPGPDPDTDQTPGPDPTPTPTNDPDPAPVPTTPSGTEPDPDPSPTTTPDPQPDPTPDDGKTPAQPDPAPATSTDPKQSSTPKENSTPKAQSSSKTSSSSSGASSSGTSKASSGASAVSSGTASSGAKSAGVKTSDASSAPPFALLALLSVAAAFAVWRARLRRRAQARLRGRI